jgi:amino acid transporter
VLRSPNDESAPGLVRAIRRWDLVALAINAIIGAGIFGLPSQVFARTGSYSLLAFLACAVVVTFIVLCFAEVSSRFTGTGGPYLYAREAFGPLIGFEVGWMTWVARVAAFAANTNLLLAYLAVFAPPVETAFWRVVAIVLIVGLLTFVNVRGVRHATVASNVLTVAKLVPLALFVAVGLFFVVPARLVAPAAVAPGDFSLSVLLLVYAFSGFELAAIPGGEVRDPGRDLPRALVVSIGIVTVVYVFIQIVAIGTLPGLGTSTRPLADAAGQFLGPLGAAVISGGAVVSILGNLNAGLLVAPRLPFAMAERGELPSGVAAVHRRFRTPHVAILATAGIMLALTLSGTFVYAATISVLARLFSYAVTCLALPVFRRSAVVPPARFVVPGGPAVSALALLAVVWLVSNSTGREARDAAVAAILGLVMYGVSRRSR